MTVFPVFNDEGNFTDCKTKQSKTNKTQETDWFVQRTGMNKGIVIQSPKQFNKVDNYYQALALITHFPPNHLTAFHQVSVYV